MAFIATVADGEVEFNRASFGRFVSFFDGHFHIVYFRLHTTETIPSGDGPQFGGGVDLRGFTYERINVAWGEMLSRMSPYDRQPYAELEKVFRATGDDAAADKIHLELQRQERWRDWQGDLGRWLLSGLWGLVANYGIQPHRLLWLSLGTLLLGTWIFSRPGATRVASARSPEGAESAATSSTGEGAPAQVQSATRLARFGDGFRVALRHFAPVDLPLAAGREPSNTRYVLLRCSDWAALLKVLGWILVPLGIAALVGLLQYAPR